MGQQQLLLIILGVVIVGIAILVGMTMFQDNAVDQNRSAMMDDMTALASRAHQYYMKPQVLGGGNRSFVGLTVATGMTTLAGSNFANNANGTYSIKTDGTATQLVIHGIGKRPLADGTFPQYDFTVTVTGHTITRIN